MKIAHVSDIHIRNLKFHQDYRKVFEDFYRKLDELRPDLVVNTGDTAHTKTNISPEFVEMASQFFTEVAKRAPMLNVLGNHDLNLMNEDRQDAISPIIEALDNPNIMLLKKSGPSWAPRAGETPRIPSNFVFHNFGIADVENWPRGPYPQVAMNGMPQINIGLFHGSIRNCLTDSMFRMTNTEHDENIFDGLDFVMMGDIHKRQPFNDGRYWYAGSMIQQNFGEDPEKGFLLWDIRGRDEGDFKVDFHELKGNRRFYTVKLPEDLRVPDMQIEVDSRIRISPPRQLTLVEQKSIEKIVKKKFQPHDVITLGIKSVGQHFSQVADGDTKIENLRQPEVQERLIRQFLKNKDLPSHILQKILDLNRKYQVSLDQREDVARNVNWRVLKLGWSNLYNYGAGNFIDFSQIRGLTGIFAPNASGKSGMIDAVTVGLFDANTKEVSKNVHLINDNKDKAVIVMELLSNNERYSVERVIERIKYVKDGKEMSWGKTSLDFCKVENDGTMEKLVEETRPGTEKNICRRFGTFEDFMLTSLFAQWDPMDIIMAKETERKRILYRFLDLDIFEEKAKLAKEEMRVHIEKLAELEESGYENAASELKSKIEEKRKEIDKLMGDEDEHSRLAGFSERKIEKLLEKKTPIPDVVNPDFIDSPEVVQKRIDEKFRSLQKAEQEVKELREQHETILGSWGEFDVELNQERALEYEEAKNLALSLGASLKDHERHVAGRERQVDILNNVPCGDQFPTCQFLVDAFKAKNELPQHQAEVEEFRKKLEKAEQEAKELKKFAVALEEYYEGTEERSEVEHKIEIKTLKIQNIKNEIAAEEERKKRIEEKVAQYRAVQDQLIENERIDQEISKSRQSRAVVMNKIQEIRRDIEKANRQLGSDQGVLERVEKELAKLQEVKDTCSAFEHLAHAMGKDGIALQILTQKLPVINEEINKILGSACEFGVFIEYDPGDQSIRLNIQYGEYKSRVLELGSGAEKFLASVAIRSALLSISNLPRPNMFIIDEGFGKLDPSNLEAIQRVFDYLRSVFDHVIVISHSEIMKDMVDNTIEITADDEGYAHVEIGS